MKCHECGGKYREVDGDLAMNDPYIGAFVVAGVHYYKCDGCGQVLFPLETAEAIEERRSERKDELLKGHPLRDFLTAAETAAALGISRQALHKHRRIRRGFIHQTAFGSGMVYLEESVKRFKDTGDGRFPLSSSPGLLGAESPSMQDQLPDRTRATRAAATRREAAVVRESAPEYPARPRKD
jgi:hypothetical protein